MPTDPDPRPPDPNSGPAARPPGDAPADGAADAPPRRLGEGIDEPRVPRGCNPLVFGVVMATIQFAATIYFMRTC